MSKVLVTDAIAPEGLDLLRTGAEVDVKRGLNETELIDIIKEYEALVVRSETKVTPAVIRAGGQLKVIARAGIGVDNIDLEAATVAGIPVVNAPIGNTVAAAEHTMALMLSLARNVPQAYASMKNGEWKRSAYMGVEVRGKVLGVVGLGRVGTEVAIRARAFGMTLVAYDPFVSPDYASRLGAQVVSLDELLVSSDFITLHTPLTPNTNKLIGSRELSLMKPDARLINVARGELVDEAALLEALQADKLGGVALDVFIEEPPDDMTLAQHSKVISTPHLGASTEEAQREVAIEAAGQVLAILDGQSASNMVNAPVVRPEVQAILANLLNLVNTREIRDIDDTVEGRTEDDPGSRPNNSEVVVNGRTGLVLDRDSSVLVPSVSGTSVTQSDIDALTDQDSALLLIYRMRQEIFIFGQMNLC